MLYLISLLSFLLPTQLGFHFNSFNSVVYGFKIDYLIPTLYLSDITALLIIVFGFRTVKFTKLNCVLAIIYLGFAAINIQNSLFIIPAIYKWFKITEMILLGVVIVRAKKFSIFKNFINPLSYSVLVACILGVWQFFKRSSVGGIFYWFGERNFIFSDPNIAPYPYSIFSHPNSFAGFLLVFGIFLLKYRKKFSTKYFWILTILISINILLTNSLNIYLAIGFLLLVSARKTINFSFLIVNWTDRFISHRLELINASLKIIKENFWFGVGLNNFIPNLVKVSNTYLNAWELQPVHNIFLLMFSEVGVIGFAIFCFTVFFGFSFLAVNYSLLVILITGLSDHYWLTLQQNMLLFTYVLAISKTNAKKS